MTRNRQNRLLSAFRPSDASLPHSGAGRKNATAFRRFAKGLRAARRQKMCRHEFDLSDLRKTGIQGPPRPSAGSGYQDFVDWHHECSHGDCFKKRVVWPCAKCGKVFYAHCGLDISPTHGPLKERSDQALSTDNHQLTTGLKLRFYAIALRFKRCRLSSDLRPLTSGFAARILPNTPNRVRRLLSKTARMTA